MDRFYMCLVEGTERITKRWDNKADAADEAERLARMSGKPVYLLEGGHVCTLKVSPPPIPIPVEWEILT